MTAVTAAGESEQTTASKRVFTKESIQQTLQLLGMAPEAELLTDEELSNQFNAPEDYVKSLIGDQKNVVFAPVNPDLSALVGNAALPSNIRTSHAGSFSRPRARSRRSRLQPLTTSLRRGDRRFRRRRRRCGAALDGLGQRGRGRLHSLSF